MKYIITIIAFVSTLLLSGCGSDNIYQRSNIQRHSADTLIGSWYTYGAKYIKGGYQIQEIKKEQFMRNGQLYSSKWFNLKDRVGRDLGEFYITKLFSWKFKGNRVVAKFNRCSVGISKPLKVHYAGYVQLRKACRESYKRSGRITVKHIRFIDNNRVKLGNKVYNRE